MLNKERLRQVFSKNIHNKFKIPKGVKESAVIVPFIELNGKWYLIFEKKAKDNSKHAGQMAFPGGSKDTSDRSYLDTAIRETCEEISVCKNDLEILGEIEPTITLSSNFVIYPFAAIVWKKPPFKINRSEVEKLVFVPLSYLLEQFPFETKVVIINGVKKETKTIEYDGEIIWGASARILNNFLPLLKDD